MYFDVTAKKFAEEHTGSEKIAFAASDRDLSWRDLKTLSDKICGSFQKTGIPEGHPMLVYGDKEAFFLATILSCYRKNLPFVPLSSDLPIERLKKIIAQTGSNVLVNCTDAPVAPQLPVTIDESLDVTGGADDWHTADQALAYILFTSGSTGEPKGVKITNENIAAFTCTFVKEFPVNKNTVFINQASFQFDISLADLFGSLQTGGTAIFNSHEEIRGNLFFERIKKYKGTYWNSTPSFLSMCFTNKDFNSLHFPAITCFTLSGENLSPTIVSELRLRFSGAKIINAYGPTETCIFASHLQIEANTPADPFFPISKFPATDLSIENDELILSGKQVGQGYLNGNEFAGKFKTGDRVEAKNDLLYCRGRNDEQIKFNGYRIELNEIKLALESFEFVLQAECVPVIIDEKIKRLIAFVKLKENSEKEISSLKQQLQSSLPHYMVPGEIIPVKEFPLSASSKVDKKKLLEDHRG